MKRRNVVVISDLHAGCRLALCPPEGVPLDDGGIYRPSRIQGILWDWWTEFWEKWVPHATHGEPYDVVLNGDAVEGVHHGAVTQISQNIEDQKILCLKILRPVFERCGGRFYWVRGTEAHVGKSAQFEEALARELGAIPNQQNQYARYELWLNIGERLVHFLHHIGTTGSSAYESTAVWREMIAELEESARWGERPLDMCVRSHRHRCIEVRAPGHNGFKSALVTPSWQLKTPFAWKLPGARLAPPQIGGIVLRVDDAGQLYSNAFVKTPKRDKPE